MPVTVKVTWESVLSATVALIDPVVLKLTVLIHVIGSEASLQPAWL